MIVRNVNDQEELKPPISPTSEGPIRDQDSEGFSEFYFAVPWSPERSQRCSVQLDTSTSAGIQSWKEAIRDLSQPPVLEFGVTGYRFVDAQCVRVAAETGFVGLLIFFVLLGTILKHSFRPMKRSGRSS